MQQCNTQQILIENMLFISFKIHKTLARTMSETEKNISHSFFCNVYIIIMRAYYREKL